VGFPALAQRSNQHAEQMDGAEIKHMTDTIQVGATALATSKMALQKGQNDLVKQFAKFEVAEQETIAEIINSMQGASTTGVGARASVKKDEQAQVMLKKLDPLKGAEFDAEYLKGQKDGHQQLLRIQEAYLSSGKNRDQMNVAKLARGQIKEHLTLIDYINGEMKRRA
jgi:putative membrane protein